MPMNWTMLALDNRKYWLGFSLIPEIGPKRLLHLQSAFGDLAAAWHADEARLRLADLTPRAIESILQTRSQLNLDTEMARVHRVQAELLTLASATYPQRLREIDDVPPLLYARGTLLPADDLALCIVGTRKATAYGTRAAYTLAHDLAANGVTIVSGLAQGIDTAAHQGALDAGGRTIAVLAHGISEIYPRENLELARQIVEKGCVLTEYPIGTPPDRRNFPRRNRIMSGLSYGVLVVEAPERSGALITVTTALEQGREVFAVPGNIFNPESRGTNRLLQDGARLVLSAEDVLNELNIVYQMVETRTQTEDIAPTGSTETQLLGHLSADPVHIDDLVRISGLPVSEVSSTLTLLELKGLALQVGYMQYTRA